MGHIYGAEAHLPRSCFRASFASEWSRALIGHFCCPLLREEYAHSDDDRHVIRHFSVSKIEQDNKNRDCCMKAAFLVSGRVKGFILSVCAAGS